MRKLSNGQIINLSKRPIYEQNFVVLDIETTGLSSSYHKITELSAIRIRNGEKVAEFSSLVNPKTPIPKFIVKLTGINDEMVKNAPPIENILPDFIGFLSNYPIVAHNASFDYGFLNYATMEVLGRMLNNEKICTCLLARRLLPYLPSKKLSALSEHFNINQKISHRAYSDVLATVEIFTNLAEIAKRERKIEFVEDLIEFQSSKIR